jgi:hypothetical protein
LLGNGKCLSAKEVVTGRRKKERNEEGSVRKTSKVRWDTEELDRDIPLD